MYIFHHLLEYVYEFIYTSKKHKTYTIETFNQLKISRYLWKYPVPNLTQIGREM